MGDSPAGKGQLTPAKRRVYVLPEEVFASAAHDEISLRDLWHILWRGKSIIVAVTTVFFMFSVMYSLLATEWYRAEVLLVPAEDQSTSSIGGQLGGLAALAGVSVEGDGVGVEALAVAKSREFARAFIEDFNLLPVFFSEDWDAENNRWLGSDPQDWPDIRSAVKFFHENLLRVTEDSKTGLVTLAIEWTDPDLAAEWASELVDRLNARLRERALREAESNVAYLRRELAETGVVTLQQSIGRLLENELQKLMLARGNEEFAFRVIDRAQSPKEHVRPRRLLIVAFGTLLGGMLGVFGVFIWSASRFEPEE